MSSGCGPEEQMRAGDHACLIHAGAEELRAVLGPWISKGLAAGERCLLVLNEEGRERRLGWLREEGIDVEAECARRALVISDMRSVYRDPFEPQAVLDGLRTSAAQAKASGFTGLRAAGELCWAHRTVPGADRLEEYERAVTGLARELGIQVLCLYDAAILPPHRLAGAYRTHPLAVVHGRMRPSALCGSGSATMGGADRPV